MMTLKWIVYFLVVILLSGCGGGGITENYEEEILTKAPSPYDAPSLSETSRDNFLDLINTERTQEHDCGHYEEDADGKVTIVYDGTDIMPATDKLTWSIPLYSASAEHSHDLAAWNHNVTEEATAIKRVSHTGSGTETDWTATYQDIAEGSSIAQRIKNNNYLYQGGENIAVGTEWDTPEEAVTAWIKSPGHCKNLMNTQYKEVGMALVEDENSFYHYYWTQNLGIGQ